MGLCLALLAIAVVGPIVTAYNAQPASRYALTAALADHGSVDLGPYEHILGVDHARYEGELRSDKPPGQPLLGVPVYLAGRVVGFESATHLRSQGDLGLWWQTLWSSMLPFAATVALMFAAASAFVSTRRALFATSAVAFGTIMMPHAASLYGHSLAACLGFAMWRVVDGSRGSSRRVALAGLLGAGAVAVEYHAAIVVAVVMIVAAARWRERALWAALGAVPPAIVTGVYHRAAFGHAWRLPYTYYAGKLGAVPTSEGGYTLPKPQQIVDVLFGRHGLLFVSPIVLVAVVAAIVVAREARGRPERTHALVAIGVFVPYFALIAGWSGTPLLEEPGPRYLIPALPFLVVPLAVTWDRLSRAPWIAAIWGTAVCFAGTVTLLFVGPGDAPFRVYLTRVLHGDFNPTLWSMTLGGAAAVVYVASIVVAVEAVRRAVIAADP